jgi:hypothetical protein
MVFTLKRRPNDAGACGHPWKIALAFGHRKLWVPWLTPLSLASMKPDTDGN